MPTIQEVRQQYPQYSDMSDSALADALHSKFYADMPRAEFDSKIGLSSQPRGVMDQLLGTTGPRYQTWPERAVRGIGSAIADLPSLPQRALESSETMRQGGDYNPAPIVEAATLASPVPVALRAGEKIIPGMAANLAKREPPPPTASELKLAGATDIQAAKASPLSATPESAAGWSVRAQQRLLERGITDIDAPATYAKLRRLEDAPAGSQFTATNMQSFRHSLGKTAQSFNPQAAQDQLAASLAIKDFDTFIPSLGEKDVLAGSPAATQALFERGRGNYAAAMRSNSITGELDRAKTGILERAQGRAQAANSGRNLDNTIRSKVESVLEKRKEVSGFNDPEIAALNSVVEGSGPRNTARYIGNLLGGGGGIGQSGMAAVGAAFGAGAGGLPGALMGGVAPAAAGAGAKSIANALARKSLSQVDELIRTRSPLYQEALRAAESYAPGVEKRAAIAKALLMGALTQ